MPPTPTRPASAGAGRDGGPADEMEAPAEDGTALLVARLDAAEEAGEVDARQLADLLGVTPGALRRALAHPAALGAEAAEQVARALGVDRAAMRALRRAGARGGAGAPAGGSSRGSVDGSLGASAGGAGPRPPGSTLELLEGVLRAVRGDVGGRRLRAAVLDVAEEAARRAGRPLPPAVHALRARLTGPRGNGAADGHDSDVPDAAAPAGDATGAPRVDSAADAALADAALVAAAADAVRELQRTAPGYDDLFAPLHDDALADLLRRHAVAVHDAAGAAPGTRFVVTPALYGRHRLVVPGSATPDQRRLAARAALAHLIVGHVGEAAALPSPAPPSLARLADLVALADLVPFWQLADARRRGGRAGGGGGGGARGGAGGHAAEACAMIAGDWDAARAADRGALRVALFRAHQF